MFDIIIIGGGPAGLTAAIYSKRAGKKVLILESSAFGGNLLYANKIENYPGFMGIDGFSLSQNILKQAKEIGVETKLSKVTEIRGGNPVKVFVDNCEYECKKLIIASGTSYRKLNIINEEKFAGKGVSYCAICDGAFFKGKDVCVVGGGNVAVHDAVYLSDICSKVYLIHRRDYLTCEQNLKNQLESRNNIEYLFNSNVVDLQGENFLSHVVVKNNKTDETKSITASGIFITIGRIPQNKCFSNEVVLDKNGYIVSDESCSTSNPNIFAAGDCRTKDIHQITTAVGDGTIAAMKAITSINNEI